METKLKMVYWKSDKFWVGKLVDHPEIIHREKHWKSWKII